MSFIEVEVTFGEKVNLGNYESAEVRMSVRHTVQADTQEDVDSELTMLYDVLKAQVNEKKTELKAEVAK